MIAIFADNIKNDCKLLKILKMIVLFADNIKDDDDSWILKLFCAFYEIL